MRRADIRVQRPAGWRGAQRGLTLIELVVTLAVLATLAALAWPSFGQQLERQRLKATAETLASDFAEARFEAAQRGTPLHLTFARGADWCYAVGTSPGCDCHTRQRCQLKTVHAADVPGVALLDSRDAVLDPAGVAPMAASALLGTAQGEQLRVALSPLGRTRVCAPASSIGRYPRC